MKPAALFLTLALLIGSAPVFANESEAKASEAVANVLFDFDGSNEFVSYVVRPDGFVDAVFARNTPEPLYTKVVEKLRAHPDIKGVLPAAAARPVRGFDFRYYAP